MDAAPLGILSISNIDQVLQKPFQKRSTLQNKLLQKSIMKYPSMIEMKSICGAQLPKILLSSAKVKKYYPNMPIFESNTPIRNFFLILSGSVTVSQQLPISESLSFLTTIAHKPHFKQQKAPSEPALQNQLPPQISLSEGEIFCLSKRITSAYYKRTIYAAEKLIVVSFELSALFQILSSCLQHKIKKSLKVFQQIPLFSLLSKEELTTVIQHMTIKQIKKNQEVFKEGDPSTYVYVLESGQITLSKDTDLFVQNPNDLYVDRRTLEYNPLPYANLTDLFNYRPIKRRIQIAVLTPLTLFGEEQLISNVVRETDAICTSAQGSYYQIQSKYICGVVDIRKNKQKLAYRQMKYASAIQVENTNHLTYFFDNGKGDRLSKQHQLHKINQKIRSKSLKKHPYSQEGKTQPIPAFYNTFNFRKMIGRKETSLVKTTDLNLSEEEQKVVEMVHSSREISDRVRGAANMFGKSGKKHSINFKQPLIDEKYFRTIEESILRIDRSRKNQRFSTKVIKAKLTK